MPLWSLKRRILLIIVGLLGLAITVLGTYFVETRETFLHRQLVDRGTAASQQLALLTTYTAGLPEPRTRLEELADTIIEERPIRSVTIHLTDPPLEIRSGPTTLPSVAEDPLSGPAVAINRTAESLLFVRPLVKELRGRPDQNIGWVEIEYANHTNTIQMFQSLMVTGMVILVLLVGLVAAALLLTARYSRKMDKILAVITNAEQDSYATEIPLEGDGDELDILAEKLNEMWRTLYDRRKESERSTAQTTRDLRETLETLEIQNIELDIARKAAVNASHVKSEFLANTSHEIRTPLNGIIGFTNLLVKTPLSDKQMDLVKTIRQSANGLLRIINDLLDFSKLEAGKLVLDYIAYSLYDVFEETLTLMAPTIGDKLVSIATVYRHDVPEMITGDPQRVQQVVTNLVHNAIKFTPAGEVTIEARAIDNRSIEILVHDTGVGMTDEQQSRLFSAFSQADRSISRQYGGTGLGLVIAQRLVEQMGSSIKLESEPGHGSTFSFTLESKSSAQQKPQMEVGDVEICFFHTSNNAALGLQQLLKRWQIAAKRVDSLDALTRLAGENPGSAQRILLLGLGSSVNPNDGLKGTLQTLSALYPTILLSAADREDLNTVIPSTVTRVSEPLRRQELLQTIVNCTTNSLPAESATCEEQTPSQAPLIQQRLLIVDDNRANLKLLKLMLENEYMHCVAVTSGQEAVDACQKESFNLIFMDIQMPGMSGLEAAKNIRQNCRANATTPVIAVTAHAQTDDRAAFIRAGMNDYLGKPILEEQLLAILKKWCRQTEAPVTNSEPNRNAAAAEPLDLPVDLAECLEISGHKPAIAKDMLAALLDDLPESRKKINTFQSEQDIESYVDAVHYLHGLACYTGVPALRELCKQIQSATKSGQPLYALELGASLDQQIERLLKWHEDIDLEVLFET